MGADWKENYDKFIQHVRSGMTKNLTAAGALLVTKIKSELNQPARTVSFRTQKNGKTRKMLGKQGSDPSKPGEPPRKRTGKLRKTVKKKLIRGGKAIKVMDKGRALEFGTSKMPARPHMRPALANNASDIATILVRPIPDKK